MRAGGRPFIDVYSSQGPAFLPLLWLSDLLGLRTWWAPRLLPVIAGVAATVLVHRIGLRMTDRVGAAIGALLVATSGCLLYSTERIESDGVAIAFAAAAVLVASGSGRRRLVLATVLLGVAVAVKSLFVAPAALAVVWLVWRRGGWRPALAVGAGAAAVVLAVSVPWGLDAVWHQFVVLHLRAGDGLDVGANRDLVRRLLRHRDRLLLWTAAAAAGWSALRWAWSRPRPGPLEPGPTKVGDLHVALWLWLLGSVVVLLLHQPLFLQHVCLVVPPAALLVALHRPPLLAVALVVVLLLPAHGAAGEWRRTSITPTERDQVGIDLLRRIEPREAKVISDAPALVWFAGRTSPGALVDPSFVRIETGELVTADVVAAAARTGGVRRAALGSAPREPAGPARRAPRLPAGRRRRGSGAVASRRVPARGSTLRPVARRARLLQLGYRL